MVQQVTSQIKKHNLPPQPTSFIGRVDEVAEVTKLLIDPACRLLTLVGPGGIGKTRLAIQVGTELLDSFSHGVYFVALQHARSADFLAPAIADALHFSLRGQEPADIQLLNYLHDKEILLVLDNLEHLLAQPSIDLITALLHASPQLKLMFTSQEVLNLQEEWLYHVQGMPFPTTPQSSTTSMEMQENYSAVQLFVDRARRVRRDFSLVEEQAAVVRICQLVEGIPLAIELAASWTKTLRCGVIADEIQRNIDFLTTSLRNVPDRQRSMRAVFDHSWQRLSQEERSVFMHLSVFRGGFQHEAAEWLAAASLATLSALVDKSLLRLEANGRYQIHELLRQYAADKLAQSNEDVVHIYDLHCAYYANFLYQRLDDMNGGQQRAATADMGAELENIRVAWQWAVELVKVEEIQKSAQALDAFYQFQSRYLEAAKAFENAVRGLDSQEPTEKNQLTLAQLLVFLGWYYVRLGRFEEAKTVVERSDTIYAAHETSPLSGLGTDPLAPLAILAIIRGDYAEAAQLGERMRQTSEARADQQNLLFSYYLLTSASLARGQYEMARHYARQAYDQANVVNDRWFMAYCLNEWGNVARAMEDYAEARQHYQASYAIRQEFEDPEGMAVALNHLGQVAVLEENYAEAKRLFEQALSLYQEINDRGGLATSLHGLGRAACALGDYRPAQKHLQQALQIATDIQFVTLTLSIVIGIGELLWQTGQQERGVELLAFAYQHPASDREIENRAQKCLAYFEAELPSDIFAEAMQHGQNDDFQTLTAALPAELAALQVYATTTGGTEVASHPSRPLEQPLVEPLTPRELEVLQLIATGLTNQQIASELVISVGTVKSYTNQIYGKLDVHTRTQAVARARELGLIS